MFIDSEKSPDGDQEVQQRHLNDGLIDDNVCNYVR